MDPKAIETVEKTAVQSKKPMSASGPPKASNPNAESVSAKSVSVEKDSVTVSDKGRLALEQANQSDGPDSTPVNTETGAGDSSSVKGNLQRKFSITENKQVVMQIIDPKTKDVVKQVPAEEQLRLSEAIRSMVEDFSPPNESE